MNPTRNTGTVPAPTTRKRSPASTPTRRTPGTAQETGSTSAPCSQVIEPAISHEELTVVPEVIALGYGKPKAAAVDAVLRSGMVSTLVTDTAAAVPLLALAEKNPPH
jgi:hypothetical protein